MQTGRFAKLTYTPSVLAVQQEMHSNAANRLRLSTDDPQPLSEDEIAFIAERDSFYMATVNEEGWPYIQHRGGPKGFLHVIDEHTLAFADVSGNRQYISTGNLRANDRVALFLMDYPHRARLKLLAHASITPWNEAPADLRATLTVGDHARPERLVTLRVEAFDWNCPQNITPRWTADEILSSPVGRKIDELQRENERLREELASLRPRP